jgi:hypothetical protein
VLNTGGGAGASKVGGVWGTGDDSGNDASSTLAIGGAGFGN